MSDEAAVLGWVHRQNIERYERLLGTELTAVERRLIQARLVEKTTTRRRPKGAVVEPYGSPPSRATEARWS